MQDRVLPIENKSCSSSSTKKEDACKIFVGGLSWDTTREKLAEYFGTFGEIVDCVLMLDTQTRRSRGFGFVTYASPNAVYEVLASCPHFLDGKFIDPKAAVPKLNYSLPQKGTSMSNPVSINSPSVNLNYKKYNKIFVGGIGQASEEDLRAYFSSFGGVTEVSIIMDKLTGRPRGFAFVGFDDCRAAESTVNVRYHSIRNKKVEVKKALPRDIKIMENCMKDFNSFNPDDLMFSNLSIHDAMAGMDGMGSDTINMSPQIWKPTSSIPISNSPGHHLVPSILPVDVPISFPSNCVIPPHLISYPNSISTVSGLNRESILTKNSDFGDSSSYSAAATQFDNNDDITASTRDHNQLEYYLAFEQNENRLPHGVYSNSASHPHGYHYPYSRSNSEDTSVSSPNFQQFHSVNDIGAVGDRSLAPPRDTLKKTFSDMPVFATEFSSDYSSLSAKLGGCYTDTTCSNRTTTVDSYDSLPMNNRSECRVMNSNCNYSSKCDRNDNNTVTNNFSDSNSVFINRSCENGTNMESKTWLSSSNSNPYPSQRNISDSISTGTNRLASNVMSGNTNHATENGIGMSSPTIDGDENPDNIPPDLRTNIMNLLHEIFK